MISGSVWLSPSIFRSCDYFHCMRCLMSLCVIPQFKIAKRGIHQLNKCIYPISYWFPYFSTDWPWVYPIWWGSFDGLIRDGWRGFYMGRLICGLFFASIWSLFFFKYHQCTIVYIKCTILLRVRDRLWIRLFKHIIIIIIIIIFFFFTLSFFN